MSDRIIIEDREELIFLLCEAAEFEHAVMCTYLYALWSLRRSTDEGVTADEMAAIESWRASLRTVAREEMLHLCLVNNILSALGAAPHLWKPEFPVRPGHFPADVIMQLRPFSAEAIDHFLYIERPEGLDISDGRGFDHPHHYHRAARQGLLSPAAQDYVSQGHLYHGILQGLITLSQAWGEDRLFVGHDDAQVGGAEFGLPGLFKVTGLESARRAIEEIVTQGEGAPAQSETSHYARFAAMKAELAVLQEARPAFRPARPVVANPVLAGADGCTLVSDALAAKVVDLGNAVYALMMRALAQVFSPAPLPQELRTGLAIGSTELMYALQCLGECATTVSASGGVARAGLTFSLPRSTGQLVQSCAGQILGERTLELAGAARSIAAHVDLAGLDERLEKLGQRFTALHDRFEAHIAVSVDRTARISAPARADAPELADDPNTASTDRIRIAFDTKRCIHSRHCVLDAPRVFRANTPGKWIHADAASVDELIRVARNCPSGAITYQRRDGGPDEAPPDVNVVRVRENGPYAVSADISLNGESLTRATLCRCGQSKNKPFCDNSHIAARFSATGEPMPVDSDPLEFRGGTLSIEPLPDGPLQVLGNVEVCAGTGRTVIRAQNVRLCRCGGSSTKPFCDGTHARIGFRG